MFTLRSIGIPNNFIKLHLDLNPPSPQKRNKKEIILKGMQKQYL